MKKTAITAGMITPYEREQVRVWIENTGLSINLLVQSRPELSDKAQLMYRIINNSAKWRTTGIMQVYNIMDVKLSANGKKEKFETVKFNGVSKVKLI